MTTQNPPQNVQTLVTKFEQAINKHDANALASLYAPQARAHDPLQPQPLQGKEAIRQDAQTFFQAFPDLKMKITNVTVNGTLVGAEIEFTGTQTGPMTSPQGTTLQPTNRKLQMHGASFIRLSPEGLITEEHRYYDTGAFAQQLGWNAQAA